jgi:xylono-1,5-lactonase
METLAYGYGLAEAPVWVPPDHDLADAPGGVLLFSDVLGGGLHRWSAASGVTTVVPKRRGIGGAALHADGGVVVTGRNVQHVRGSETRTVLTLEGATGFNDMTTDTDGRIYVGSMRFMPFEGGQPVPGEVWRVDGDDAATDHGAQATERRAKATELFGDISWPNGMGFSPDGRTIYISDYAAGKVIAHDLTSTSEAQNRRVFAESPSRAADGLAVDSEGRVWVALGAGGLGRFSAGGTLEEVLEVPAGFVASLCFGGTDGRDLYITTADNTEDPARRGTVFRTRVDVPGLPVTPAGV